MPATAPNHAIPDLSITEYVFRGTDAQPDDVILTCGATGLSYTGRVFRDRVERLAGGLTAAGFGPGQVVALMAPNTPEYAVIFHAVAWAGGTITTINPTYTANELKHQLGHSGASLLITVPAFLETATAGAEGTGVRRIAVIGTEGEAALDALMGERQTTQTPVDLGQHVLAVPYSSGTTGLPKGVMLTHRNLVVNLLQADGALNVEPGETTLSFLPFFHIYGMQILMNLYLAQGARQVTLPRFDLEAALRTIQDHGIRKLYVAPPVVLALAKHPMVDQFDLSSLRLILSAAAPLGVDLASAASQRLGCVVVQGYGMTELSPITHVCPPSAPRAGSVGMTVPMTEQKIVDPATGATLAAGEVGEVVVRGPQVMLGYLDNPEATRGMIEPDGWLHTGDLGYIDQDGYLFIVDRVKELIKVKGFQVAPAELEALLVAHPAVADVAVVGEPDDEAGEVPVAHVVKAKDAEVDLAALQAYLSDKVAKYKQIARVEFRDTIPKSASGKILRRMLRK
jgi:acyl-CoA synthetase (AMP-forming)/AMP-acid ligase II